MAQLKAYEVDGWLAATPVRAAMVLVYGSDRGLVSERAKRFAANAGVPLDDPFSVVRMDGADLEREPGRLADELSTIPMFAEKRLVWVRNAPGTKGFADATKALLSAPPRDAILLLEAGELRKGSALRTAFETAASAMALPCYPDDARAVDALIDGMLEAANRTIDADARAALRRSLGGDRLASRGEIEKLLLYTQGQPHIGEADVLASTGDASIQSADDVVDAALAGDTAALDTAFSRAVTSASQTFAVLGAAQRQLQALQLMRAAMEARGMSAAAAVAGARPPLFGTRKALIERTLAARDTATLGQLMLRLHDVVLRTRQRQDLAVALTRQAMLGIALSAGRQRVGR
jgi:DNA polymerase-3 subunit delta